MYITAMTHRDELFDLALRWLNNDFHREDPCTVKRIFLYESIIATAVVDRMIGFLGNLFNTTRLQMERVHRKHLLRERIIQYLPRQTPRICELVEGFRDNPEYFFPRLSMDAVLITTPDSRLAAVGRIKRLSRVAEKISYRLADALLGEIEAEARKIEACRAAKAVVSPEALIRKEDVSTREFLEAETMMARRFRYENVRIARESLAVNDLVGFKIVGAPDLLGRVPALLQQQSGFTVVEIEKHNGNYNAVNLLVDIDLPSADKLATLREGVDWSIAARRGLDEARTKHEFGAYVAAGARSVRVEIILTTYDELMESEFGRSMHELRVLRLRRRYSGPIAQNAGYLIEYLLALAVAPTIDLQELPIKMYGRYLPETVAAAKCALFGNEIDAGILNAFCLKAGCADRFCPFPTGLCLNEENLQPTEATDGG